MESFSQHLWIGFAGGLLAFAHCLGMCGGFALHMSREPDRRRMICSHLLWQVGRITVYIFFGAVAGYAGGALGNLLVDYSRLQNLLGYITGVFILLMGMNLLGLLPRGTGSRAYGSLLPEICNRLKNSPSAGAAFFMGMITGCLPCPIVLAFLAYSLQTGSVVYGIGTMAAVGCGTMLPLLLFGMAGRWVQLRDWGARVGGLILVVLGVSTILRGTNFYHHLWGCAADPAHLEVLSAGHETCRPGAEEVRNGRH